jgi:hypothetical protein
MYMLYHSEGCNICEMEFHKCYINDLRTTRCSGMMGHRSSPALWGRGFSDGPGIFVDLCTTLSVVLTIAALLRFFPV